MIHLLSWLGKKSVSWPEDFVQTLYVVFDTWVTVMLLAMIYAAYQYRRK